jgi:predicted transposase YbfD/YdcC
MESILLENINIKSFLDALSQIEDKRDNRGKHHHLSFVITGVILAILCGRSKTSSIHRFINNRINWLKRVTKIKQGKAISRAHLPRLIDKISWASLDQIIQQHFELHLLPPHINDEWKAIDGKALRGSLKSGEKEAIIHVVSHDSRTEVTQCQQSGEKSSEITVVRELLEKTGLDHHKISLDAHHCNPKTTTQIASTGGTYVTQIKKNQAVLLAQCQALSTNEKSLFSSEDHDKSHGRLVSQYTSLYSLKSMDLDGRWEASQLATLIVIKRNSVDIKKGKESKGISYYISNQMVSTRNEKAAEELTRAIKKHWGVESNNWILDVTFNEDNVITNAKNQAHILDIFPK